MSLLDEIKQEATRVKAKASEASETTQERHHEVAQELKPKLTELYNYFKEFGEHMQVVSEQAKSKQTTVDVLIEGLGELTDLLPTDYKVATENPEDVNKFTFHFACTRAGRQDFKMQSTAAAERKKDYLRNCNLRFKVREIKDGAIFQVDNFVPVTFGFEADYAKGVLRLYLKNMGRLGIMQHMFEPDRIDNEFMDELAKVALRRPNKFDHFTGNTLSDDTRTKIRQQLEEERNRRQSELNGRGGAGIGTKLGSLFKKA